MQKAFGSFIRFRFIWRNLFIFFMLLLFISPASIAQTPEPADDEITQQKIEKIAENAGEEVDANTLLDKLNYYREHPVNLNTASRDDLEDLLLLSDIQIEALLKHIEDNGKLLTLQELQTIDELDQESIFRILPFVTAAENTWLEKITHKKLFAEGKHSLILRVQQTLEEQAGYEVQNYVNYEKNKSYAGSPQKLYARYRFTYGNLISAGITAEKDAGEEFFYGEQKRGFDYYSGHLFYRGKGIIRTIAAGDFQAQYGQGVTLWSGLAFGKSSDIMNVKKNARGLLPYASTDENSFMRGGAVALGYKKFQLDAFYSSHKIDGNIVDPDSLTAEDIVSSFLEGGYHRTFSEYEDRKTVTESYIGSHLGYKGNYLTLGATVLNTEYSLPRVATPYLYNKFDFTGDHNLNTGFDYSYLYRNVSFFGEVGRSENGGMGYLNGLLVSLDPKYSISVLQRHFDKDYQALLSNAISESSRDQNESGLMIGISASPYRSFRINAYYDQFTFPWLRYQVDAPSKGHEYMAQINYTPSKTFDTYFRVRLQSKPENFPGDGFVINPLQDVVQTNYRFSIRYKISKAFTLSNRIEYVTLEKLSAGIQKGYMVYQDVNYKPMQSKVSLSLRYILFDTDSYDTRIYAYESDVLYSYSIPFYYNRGSKYYLVVHYSIIRGIDCWLRIGRTAYENIDVISSGLEQINAPHKTEAKFQLRFQF